MAKRNILVLPLVLAIILSYNALGAGAHQSQVAFSGKVMNVERKASFSGMSSSLSGQVSGAPNAAVSNTAEIANVETTTTTESHHDVSVRDFHAISRKPPTYNMP
uniref:Uncharacterized protein n=1 Tax=Hordeum vulgare subsp. vulgare TaxID=112509 RepID=A0A8I6X0N5_HORVV